MARINHVKSAQQRYEMVPKLGTNRDPIVTPVLRKDGSPKITKNGKEIVRRITVEDRSKPKPMPTCGKCGATIEVGQPYKWVKTKSGPYGGMTKYRCATCPTWRPSELSSSKMAGVYAAQEQCDDNAGDCQTRDDFEQLAVDIADQIDAVAEEYQESADNIEEGFGHETSMSDELRSKYDELTSWAEEIRSTDFEDTPEEPVFDPDGDGTEHEEHEEWLMDEFEPWRDACIEAITSIVGDCPV